MNNKGGLFLVIGIGFLAIILLPIIFMQIFSISKPLFQVILAFVIMGYLKNLGIEGVIFWILSAILIYFLAWKYVEIASTFYVLMFLMGAGFTSSVIWGSAFMRGVFRARKGEAV
jgi:hypothetical protein